MLARTWGEAPAAYSRRKAQYRCRCCRKIITEGEPAIYARMARKYHGGNRVWAVHAECGDKRHSETYSWREVMAEWSKQ